MTYDPKAFYSNIESEDTTEDKLVMNSGNSRFMNSGHHSP